MGRVPMEEWEAQMAEYGYERIPDDEPASPADFVNVAKIMESGPEFLDEQPRYRYVGPADPEKAMRVETANLVVQRADDGGYALYKFAPATMEWTLICGYGPGEAAVAFLHLALVCSIEDDAGRALTDEEWSDPTWSRKLTNAAALSKTIVSLRGRMKEYYAAKRRAGPAA